MGTPAFPNLGKHCSVGDCKLIDFLPFTCDCCHQVFCLEHRSYIGHHCPKSNKHDVTVAVCPLCAKGVRLIPDEDPNITWESHVNTECDPSNYEKATKKIKCPVPRCKEALTFSNMVKCRDCTIEHCLKHRFGPDHNCPGPKKPDPVTPSSMWALSLAKVASSIRGLSQGLMGDGSEQRVTNGNKGNMCGGKVEKCPLCNVRFGSTTAMVEHVEKTHKNNGTRTGVMKVTIDVCPKCSKGFRNPVALVKHLDKDHGGTSKA
ncbi:hypothetical protein LguiA_014424 [Lonicera macranthoides]